MCDFEGFTLEWYQEVVSGYTTAHYCVEYAHHCAFVRCNFDDSWRDWVRWLLRMLKSSRTKNTLLSFNNVLIVSPDVIIGASFLILFTMHWH